MRAHLFQLLAGLLMTMTVMQYACCLRMTAETPRAQKSVTVRSCCETSSAKDLKSSEHSKKDCPVMRGATLALHEAATQAPAIDLALPTIVSRLDSQLAAMAAKPSVPAAEDVPIPPLIDLFHQHCLLTL